MVWSEAARAGATSAGRKTRYETGLRASSGAAAGSADDPVVSNAHSRHGASVGGERLLLFLRRLEVRKRMQQRLLLHAQQQERKRQY